MDNHTFVNILGTILLITGALVTTGWVLDIDTLKSIFTNDATMKFGVAVSFVCIGASFIFITRMYNGKATLSQIGLPAAILIIIMLPIVNSIAVFLGGDISVAMLFIDKPISSFESTPRPSEGELVSFTLIVASLIFVLSDFIKTRKLTAYFGIAVTAIGGVALVGHAIGNPTMYYYFGNINTAMSIHTAILLALSGIGLIFIGKNTKRATQIKTLRIRAKLITLFLLTSIIPNIFLAIITYIMIRDFEIIRPFGYSFAIFGIVSSIIVGIFAVVLAREIVRPIIHLKDTAATIAKGELDVKASDSTTDEFGILAKSFNEMVVNMKTSAELETKRLMEIDTAKDEFSAMITHELKTPLIPISGYAELFLDGSLGGLTDGQKEKMHVIYDNSIHLTNLIQDILDARKLELGKLKLDLQEASVKEIVKRSTDIFRPMTNRKNITVYDNTEDIVVRCDPERILQVLTNIISNAVKFVPAHNGTISINSRITDGLVMLSIEDNGIGIPKEKQTDLFKKFYQVDKALTRKSGGTGLGLAISRGIIESHGGEIWVESEQNHGTTVHFTIPRGVDV